MSRRMNLDFSKTRSGTGRWAVRQRAGRSICLALSAVILCTIVGSLWAEDSKSPAPVTTGTPTSGVAPASAPAVGANDAATLAASNAGPANAAIDLLTNSMDRLDEKYRLAIGDRITFRVIEDQEDPKSLTVTDSGDIQVPYLGPFPAEGKTCKQLAVEIKSELEKKFYYRATVVISVDAMLTKGMVYLVGAVRSPGPLEMPRNDILTISKAILRAGGFTEFANDEMVRLTRQGPNGTNQVFMMNLHHVLNKGKTEEDKTAQTGDVIYVPEKTIRF